MCYNQAVEPKYYDKPMAAPPLKSYRYPSPYGGYVMIGAKSHDDAIVQANRSLETPNAVLDRLEVWGLSKYVPVAG